MAVKNRNRQNCINNAADSVKIDDSTLIHWDQLEEWQKDNEHIHTGYVRESRSMNKVLASLFYTHNETGNIYTHLLPSVIVAGVLVGSAFTPPFVLFGIGCVLCMGMSSAFHTLKSHSHRIAILGNKLDYLGICILVASSMIALVGYAYNDHPKHHFIYVGLTTLLGSICACISLMDRFRSRSFRPVRAMMFVLYGLSGALPVVSACWEFGYEEAKNRFCLNWLLAEAFFYIFGAFLYAVRFPERVSPGAYDYVGHSHQIFHVFVVVAAWCHYQTLVGAEIDSLRRLMA